MEVKDYCESLTAELIGWKARMYDVVRTLDKMSTGEMEKFVPEVYEIHAIIEELNDRIERLERECPTQWTPEEIEMNEKSAVLRLKLEKVAENVLPSDIGG